MLVEYRLAPEHKYPAANEDCISAYNWLIKKGIPSNKIIIGGDSAGGFLTLMTLISLRDSGYPLPAAAYLLSCYGDAVNFDGETYTTRAKLDPCLTLNTTRKAANYYFDASKEIPPILSPLRQNLEGLPPLFIQVGDHEIFLNDSTRLAKRAQNAGVDVTLEIWENMWHVFQSLAIIMPESKQALKNIGSFVKKYLNYDQEDKMEYRYLTAPCGIPCFNCKVNVEKPSLKTFITSNAGNFLLFKKFNLKWNDSTCKGCRAEEGRCKAVGFTEPCKVYTCMKGKGIDFCFECEDFPCDHLHPYKNKALLLPHNTKVFNLCLMKKMGVEEWARTKATDVTEQYYKGKLHL